ncbi:hypothetical protein V3C99_012737, partial [Haemonchus contortus]
NFHSSLTKRGSGMAGQSYVQWQLQFNEQHPINGSKLATYGNGRYVFLLGNKRTDLDGQIHYTQFDLECIDLYLSVKTRYLIKGLQDIGYVLGFYALSPTILVLVDYSDLIINIKQTAVLLDKDFYTGSYFIERTYCVPLTAAFFFIHCVIGEQQCAIFAPPNTGRPLNGGESTFCCHLIPKQPWSASSDRNISMFVQRANAQVLSRHGVPLTRWESPQFINLNEIGIFLDREQGICPDPFTIVIININSGDWRLVGCTADLSTGFPRDDYDQMPIDSTAQHSATGQIALLTTYGRPSNSYQAQFARFLHMCNRQIWRAFYFTAEHFSWISPMFLHIALGITTLRSRLLYNPAAKIGVLDTTNWRWVEVYSVDDYYFTNIIMFDTGQMLIHQTDKTWNTEQYGVLRNPFVVFTLQSSAELTSRPCTYDDERETIVRRLRCTEE